MRWTVLLALSLLVPRPLWGEEAAGPEAGEVIARFIERSRANSNRLASSRLTFLRRTVAEQFDSRGAVTERKTKEQLVELRGLEQSVRLLRVDGRTPSAEESASESAEEAGQRRRFTTRADRRRRSNVDYLDERLIRRFAYTLEGMETVDGRPAFRLQFQAGPRGEEATEIADRVLGLLTGHVWIDAEEYELVKFDARLSRSFSFWGGLVGSLDRLDMALVRQRLSDGTWVNRRLDSKVAGRRVLSRFDGRFQVDQEDFRPLPADPFP